MTPEQQRIKIAEACGFTIGTKETSTWSILKNGRFHTCFSGKRLVTATLADGLKCLPDYLSDLNAMHEAEKVLDIVVERGEYREYLSFITGSEVEMIYATASQRAEAFLRTLDKWEETP